MRTITTRGGITGIVSCEPREHGFVTLLLLPKAYELITKFRTLISSLGPLIFRISQLNLATSAMAILL